MVVIIAEKPSLARNIAAGIGEMKRRDGYLEGQGYIITWAFGHLFSLVDIEAYDKNRKPAAAGEKVKWTMENLPCFPEHFEFDIRDGDAGIRRQFRIIRDLCNRQDVDTIVNAGDADREGEIIVRLCIDKSGAGNKQLLRLWLPDQTPQTVSTALREMKGENEYDLLASEGFARTYIDWLYGVNLTRYATLRTGAFLRVGRVIVPIVKAIYDRDMAIRNFVPGHYFAVASHAKTGGETVDLVSGKKFEENEEDKARQLSLAYNEAGAKVLSVKNREEILFAGKLYSLSKLQNVLGKKYKMSMEKSLKIIQGLYEKGYLTYPRTNSEYLATAEKDKVRQILSNVSKIGYPVTFKDSKSIFDDSKIESHSALTPTYKIPGKDALSTEEFQVYSTVFRRFVAVFCANPCKVSRSEIVIRVGDPEKDGEDFVLKGTVMLEKGWTQYDDYNQKDKILPHLEEGQDVNVAFSPEAKETTPPKHYTIETLNNYLKNPFKEEKAAIQEEKQPGTEEDDTEDYKAVFEGLELGTEATRTGIIDNAIKSDYIQLKKDVYSILPGGEYLISALERMKINMDKHKTSQLGVALKSVFHGKMSVDDAVKLAEKEIEEIFSAGSDDPETDIDIGYFGDTVGSCPLCGRPVVRRKKIYGCTGYQDGCKFSVSTYICNRAISVANMKLLLEKGHTYVINGFVSPKSGKQFSARLVLKDGKAVFDFSDKGGAAPAKESAQGQEDPAIPPGMEVPPEA
ncbi:MAG: topoisomerase C-terminal repeat-containing protein [Clostridia bacterium]|nr:topoisomerase C-terminal repeat-containing protein [Clostridia bacterium]